MVEEQVRRDVDWFRDEFHQTISRFQGEVAEGLQAVGRAEAVGDHEVAVALLEEQLRLVEELRAEMAHVVSGAVAVREAEAVVSGVDRPPTSPVHAAGRERMATATRGERRRGLAVLAAVVMAVCLGLPAALAPPQDTALMTAIAASAQALGAVEAAASDGVVDVASLSILSSDLGAALRDLPVEVRASPEVREWLTLVLNEQQAALIGLSRTGSAGQGVRIEVHAMLSELRLLAAALDIPLDLTALGVSSVGPAPRPPLAPAHAPLAPSRPSSMAPPPGTGAAPAIPAGASDSPGIPGGLGIIPADDGPAGAEQPEPTPAEADPSEAPTEDPEGESVEGDDGGSEEEEWSWPSPDGVGWDSWDEGEARWGGGQEPEDVVGVR